MKRFLKTAIIALAITAVTVLSSFAVDVMTPFISDQSGMAPIMTIVIICYLVSRAVKASPLDKKWMPVICGSAGGLLGAFGVIFVPDFPASDWMTAMSSGIVSGLASVSFGGTGKIPKQNVAVSIKQPNNDVAVKVEVPKEVEVKVEVPKEMAVKVEAPKEVEVKVEVPNEND